MNLLDNPIWQALNTDQSDLMEGNAAARRFPDTIGPLAGIPNQSVASYASLAQLSKPGEQLVLFLPDAPIVPSDWVLDVSGALTQMVYESVPDLPSEASIDELTEADIPAMLALTHLTKPGPFRQQTIELGTYLGIHVAGQLVAMAGVRLEMTGYTEISAVCTHPDHQGKGYAQELITAVVRHIIQRGKVPFLHTRPDNTIAIKVYEKLGFKTRRLLHLAVIRHN